MRSGVAFDKGNYRLLMEDSHIVLDDIHSVLFHAIMDGHGGIACAEFVAQHLVSSITQMQAFQNKEYKKALIDGFKHCDAKLLQLHESSHHNFSTCGCTAIASLIVGKHIFVANAGDCRGLLYHNQQIIPMSRDHKAGKSYEKQRILDTGGSLVGPCPSRGFGDFSNKLPHINNSISGKKVTADVITSKPEVQEYVLNEMEGSFLVLACDGVWDKLRNEEAIQVVRSAKENGLNAQQAARALVEEALKRRTMDNVSVIVLYL